MLGSWYNHAVIQNSGCTCILGWVQKYLDQAIYIFFFHTSPSTGQKHHFSKEGRMGLRKMHSLAFVVGAEIISRVIIRAKTHLLWYFYAVLCSTFTRKSCAYCTYILSGGMNLLLSLSSGTTWLFSSSVFNYVIRSCLAGRSWSVFYSENPSVAAVKVIILISVYCITVRISLWINLKLPFCEYLCISGRGVCWMQLLAQKCLQDQGRLRYNISWG